MDVAESVEVSVTVDIKEAPYGDVDVYDDCVILFDVVSQHLVSGKSLIKANLVVDENGGILRSGDAEKSDAESDDDAPQFSFRILRHFFCQIYIAPKSILEPFLTTFKEVFTERL
ncbi:hypothetical protein C8J57DRAFT_1525618 [Mycena rebaudengoi]|nr:hypothetical protein C8J57DRAFT_1525618 [Mycena rebaudengoi]